MSGALSVIVAIIGLGLLIILHEGGHYIAARLCGMRVERFSLGFGPPIASFRRWGTQFQIAPIPLGGFVQITGLNPHEEFDANDPMVYPNRPAWMRLFTIVAGPLANYITAFLVVLFLGLTLGVKANDSLEKVQRVIPGKPAAVAGLQPGDIITSADGRKINLGYSISNHIQATKGAPVALELLRNGKPVHVTVTPVADDKVLRIGVELSHDPIHLSVGEGLRYAVRYPYDESRIILSQLYLIITHQQKAELSGPPQIVAEIANAAKSGAWEFFNIIAVLSVYLGLFNLLPIPALDGGRAVFIGLGALLRRKINARTEATIHTVGLVLLLGVLVVVSLKDIRNLFFKG